MQIILFGWVTWECIPLYKILGWLTTELDFLCTLGNKLYAWTKGDVKRDVNIPHSTVWTLQYGRFCRCMFVVIEKHARSETFWQIAPDVLKILNHQSCMFYCMFFLPVSLWVAFRCFFRWGVLYYQPKSDPSLFRKLVEVWFSVM